MLGRVHRVSWGKWCQADWRTLKIRGPDYLHDKKKPKIPAQRHRFEACFCEIYACKKAREHVADHPDSYYNKQLRKAIAAGRGREWVKGTTLKYLIVSFVVPGTPQYNFVMYFRNPAYFAQSASLPAILPSPSISASTSTSTSTSTGHDASSSKGGDAAGMSASGFASKPSSPRSSGEGFSLYETKGDDPTSGTSSSVHSSSTNEKRNADPFCRLVESFVDGADAYRCSRFKYIPNVVEALGLSRRV